MAWLSSPASAQARVETTGDYLQRMDANGDGRVSLEEYLAWMSYAFDAMDANGDGVLDPAEQPGGKGTPITRSQHIARLTARFQRQDVNHDGFLSATELAAPPQ
ncbi:EF-hand domain-containing protein [Novilysobacter avium]|uniref:Calcium-dependent protein kinase 21 n=1 Tax=Novilysobacter avium TaxID=2781023 RepID=A0A7S6UMW8_9GAMM|nr:calcium-dependent protein kinase 21 [Lysobacter avium]QOW23215.1 calcium-dependent protein kinase 21 [Lysobacter avium]